MNNIIRFLFGTSERKWQYRGFKYHHFQNDKIIYSVLISKIILSA